MLKEKLFNIFKNFFGIQYEYSEALSYNKKSTENNIKNVALPDENFYNGTKFFFQDGSLYSVLVSKKKDMEEWSYFFKNQNQILKKVIITNDFSIEKEEYYLNSNKKRATLYKHGENYEKYFFYFTGDLEKIFFYVGDDFSSYQEYSYYINGNLKEKKQYKNKILVGKYERYEEDGLLAERGFRNYRGNLDGIYKLFHRNGTLFIEKYYNNGKLMGFLKEYYNNMQLKKIELYCNDVLVQELGHFNQNGKDF